MFNLFRRREVVAPVGDVYTLFSDMARQPHLLIAGATGSGKSVVINGIMYNLLHETPDRAQFILIDPKRVELLDYKPMPHCIKYATEPEDRTAALDMALDITEQRYKVMAKRGERRYSGGHIYVIIDELADLMTTQRKDVVPRLQRLCQIGRAANVHVIAATQCPLATVIPTQIGVNFDSRVGLRTRNAQDSRNILARTGCEELPRYGYGYYMTPEGIQLYKIPMYSDDKREALLRYWKSAA